jgi:hypothetical protein
MARIDPERERQRLIDFYSGQMDGELEKVARQAAELTDVAREVLRAELGRRGLNTEPLELSATPPVADKPPSPPPPPIKTPPSELPAWLDPDLALRELVTLRKFRDMPEALLAKGCLESAGIDSCFVDDNLVRLDWFWSNLIGGIKLQVDPKDLDIAEEILDQPIPEGFDVVGIGEYQQPHCPKCQSLDVTFQELNRPISYATAWLGVPIPIYRRAWRCHSCDSEWEDDGIPGSPESTA